VSTGPSVPALTLDPVADPRWREFVERSPDAGVFHHPAWLALLRDEYGYELTAPCVVDRGGQIEAGIPFARIASPLTGRRLVALPFSDVCAPLVAAGGTAVAQELVHELERLHARSAVRMEIRAEVEQLTGARLSRAHVQHVLVLPDPESAERGSYARSAARRGAARARREGLVCQRRTDAGALDAFYALHLQTRRHQGVPIQPRRFIAALGALLDREMGFVTVVSAGGQPVAGAVFLHFQGALTYKYGASDRAHLDKRPNNLLFMDTIAWAAAAGMRTLDFGRTETANHGLRSFKRLWGAEERPLAYTHLGGGEDGRGAGRGRRVTAAAIRRGPPWVGRAIGAALYRHYG
jgi:CelD/BcsL family acetyltransferase involved in cellulose biosynthesis